MDLSNAKSIDHYLGSANANEDTTSSSDTQEIVVKPIIGPQPKAQKTTKISAKVVGPKRLGERDKKTPVFALPDHLENYCKRTHRSITVGPFVKGRITVPLHAFMSKSLKALKDEASEQKFSFVQNDGNATLTFTPTTFIVIRETRVTEDGNSSATILSAMPEGHYNELHNLLNTEAMRNITTATRGAF